MEDISRELEKEIAQSKPSPYKKSRKKRILVVDDLGEIKSAGHLKVLIYLFLVISIICFFAVSGFYYLFSNQIFENKLLKSKLTGLEEKFNRLVNEKEVLMARLVISGKALGIQTRHPLATAKEKKSGIKEKPDPKIVNTAQKTAVASRVKELTAMVGAVETKEDKNVGLDQAVLKSNVSAQQMVAIEKFTVTRDGVDGDLLVRFDIRNVSDKSGGVSGRIFTILKPESKSQEEWLVVPAVPLKKGVPSQYRKGQYFSIAHFKPVKFRIKNQAGPDFFKKAAIYIFNENGALMFESRINITEGESG
ncbi:MAG: hypothetical protein GY710_17985 [Desulfobacteraceae bacterium]|nr:hypothetical protein [Desulfobacteraceae bacterium]